MPTSAIKDLLKKWEDVRVIVLQWHPNQTDVRSPERINPFHIEVYGESMIGERTIRIANIILERIMFVNRSPTVYRERGAAFSIFVLGGKTAKAGPVSMKGCAAFYSRRESITGESPTSFPEENTAIPYSRFEPEPTRLQAEGHIHHTDQGQRNLSWQGASSTSVVSLTFEHHTIDSMICLGSSPILWENTLRGQRLPPTSRDVVLFRVAPSSKDTLHLQTFMLSLEFEPRPYGTAVSVINHYTGWVSLRNVWSTMEQIHDADQRLSPLMHVGPVRLEPDEIDNLIEEVIDLASQVNLEVDSDDVQLLDSHIQKLTINELIEMHEQDIE
ncbi:hypothetical protein TNCV_4521151 [Trichonephila clavipes]|nr:hypothetical protein TNCV_4521151 [Trichonephila clavipes]